MKRRGAGRRGAAARPPPATPEQIFGRPVDFRTFALGGLLLLAFFYTLYFARTVVLPLVLAGLLSLVFSPVVARLQRSGVPRWAGAASVVVLLVASVAYGVRSLVGPARSWIEEAPENLRRLEEKLHVVTGPVAEVDRATERVSEQVERLTGGGREAEAPEVQVREETVGEVVLSETGELVAGGATLLLLLFFLLTGGDRLLRKLVKALRSFRQKRTAVLAARRLQSEVSRYLLTMLLINVGLGAAVSGAMLVLGMPTPLLWGVMAAALNFIPYLGPTVGVGVVAAVSLLTFEGIGRAALPPLAYLGLNMLEGGVITPTIMSVQFTLDPVAVFVSLLFWGWMWGIPGVLLAVPILATVKIFCDHYEPLSGLGTLLGR